jgi:hypothetical protein
MVQKLIAVLLGVLIVAVAVTGFMVYTAVEAGVHQDKKTYQQIKDVNDNLCQQQAYGAGASCSGG